MILHKIDIGTGQYIGDVIVGDDPQISASEISPAFIETHIPEGIVHPRWSGTEWVEDTLSGDFFDVVYQTNPSLAAEERLAALEGAMLDVGALLSNMLTGDGV